MSFYLKKQLFLNIKLLKCQVKYNFVLIDYRILWIYDSLCKNILTTDSFGKIFMLQIVIYNNMK